MIEFDICQNFLARLNDASESFMTDTLTNISSSMRPFAITLMLIYLSFVGVRLFFGQANIRDVIPQMIKISVVFSIVTNPAIYNQYFGDWLWQLPEALAGLVLNGQTNNTASFLDTLLSQFYELKVVFSDIADKKSTMGIPDLDFLVSGWIVLGSGIILTMFAVLIVALSKVAIAILLSVGTIFIMMINAQSTRKFFDAWIGQIMTFSFTVMLLSAVLKLVISLLQGYLTGAVAIMANTSIDPTIDQLVPIFMLSGVAILMLLQISNLASALGGGIAINTFGAFKESGNQLKKSLEYLKVPRAGQGQNSTTNNSIRHKP
jgi:type IV secretion system protein VirB6